MLWWSTVSIVFCATAGHSSCDRNLGDWFQKLVTELRRVVGLHQILAVNVITCLEPLLNCQCRLKYWYCGYTWRNILLRLIGLTVTETNITKVQKQDLEKTLKVWKDVGMACQKICKQGRDIDRIVKVNLQSPISTFTMQGWGFVTLPSLLYPYLVCILFGIPSLHLFITFLSFTSMINYKTCL